MGLFYPVPTHSPQRDEPHTRQYLKERIQKERGESKSGYTNRNGEERADWRESFVGQHDVFWLRVEGSIVDAGVVDAILFAAGNAELDLEQALHWRHTLEVVCRDVHIFLDWLFREVEHVRRKERFTVRSKVLFVGFEHAVKPRPELGAKIGRSGGKEGERRGKDNKDAIADLRLCEATRDASARESSPAWRSSPVTQSHTDDGVLHSRAVVRVDDGDDAVLFSHEPCVHREGDGPLDGCRLVLVVERLASVHGSTTLRDLEDDWRASNL